MARLQTVLVFKRNGKSWTNICQIDSIASKNIVVIGSFFYLLVTLGHIFQCSSKELQRTNITARNFVRNYKTN